MRGSIPEISIWHGGVSDPPLYHLPFRVSSTVLTLAPDQGVLDIVSGQYTDSTHSIEKSSRHRSGTGFGMLTRIPETLSLETPTEYDSMSGPKTLTIGITVNLEHYENLRLEVSGEVNSYEDALDLARFLHEVLGTYGAGDPGTRDRIGNFQKRVFPPISSPPGVPKVVECSAGICPIPESEEPEPAGSASPDIPEATAATAGPFMTTSPPVHTSSAPIVNEGEAVITCEECGAVVNPSEQKMSMLFTSRTLCRKCLKKV